MTALREREREVAPADFGAFRLAWHSSGIALLWFEDPARKVNLLDSTNLDSLHRSLAALQLRATPPRALLLVSGKDGQYIAGADVAEFDSAETPADVEAKARDAQLLFDEFAKLPYPTVAAIDGPCLGGGAELALAFHYRIASDRRSTAIGFPEVRLGILPGFGGTQRLPRVVGFTQALSLIVSGRNLDGYKARKIGLVDEVIPHERFVERAADWTEALLARSHAMPHRAPAPLTKALEMLPPYRSAVMSQARKTVEKQTGGHYPAPFEIIRVLGATWGMRIADGLKIERKAVARLLFTPESRNLRRIFLMGEDAKRSPATPRADAVDNAGVLGAGTMGGEIAYLFSQAGLRVRLRDIKPEAILKSMAHARSLFDREVSRRRMTRAEEERAMGRIEPTLDLGGFQRADLVLEAVVEDLNVKQRILREMEDLAPDSAVFATNTSSLSVRAIASAMHRPGRLVGMHFFNPATRMPLVEVIRTAVTDPDALETVIAFTRRLKKTPVLVNDAPGFLVNRVLMPYLGEAVVLVERGVEVETIDDELRAFGMPMGPLELLDEIGLDVARKVSHVLEEAFRGRVVSPGLIDKLASEGALGKKSGLGFYRYEHGSRKGVNPTLVPQRGATKTEMPEGEIRNRLIDAMVNEASLALEERVVERPDDVDLAMVYGTGFPPFRGGLLRHADAEGIGAIVERLTRRHQEGAPSGPSGKLQRMALGNERFYRDDQEARSR